MIGIYKITNPNNLVYIGQSRNIEVRFKYYKSLHKSVYTQIKLARSFEKYGVENHIFEVIEECLFEDLNIKERYYQEMYDVLNRDKGLNLILTKTDIQPSIFSEEVKLKMSIFQKNRKRKPLTKQHIENLSKSHIGISHTEEHKDKMGIPVIQLDLENNIVNEFTTITNASKSTGVHLSNIARTCSKERKTAGGFIWRYKNDYELNNI